MHMEGSKEGGSVGKQDRHLIDEDWLEGVEVNSESEGTSTRAKRQLSQLLPS